MAAEKDRKTELCQPAPFAIRAIGTVALMVCAPYYLLKAFVSI